MESIHPHLREGLRFMQVRQYTSEELVLAQKFISNDALSILVCHNIAMSMSLCGFGYSVVRMGDGEKAIIDVSGGSAPRHFLVEQEWLTKYGLVGADLVRVGADLVSAAMKANIFAPNIYGIVNDHYNIIDSVPQRSGYAEGLYAYAWAYMGRVENVLKYGGPVIVVCREAMRMCERLAMKYKMGLPSLIPVEYSSWRDYDRAFQDVVHAPGHLVLCAGGPSIKNFVAQVAEQARKVVLDVGSALFSVWV